VSVMFANNLAFCLKIRVNWHKNLHNKFRKPGILGFLPSDSSAKHLGITTLIV
jgi:hypothetical protein